MVDDYRSPAERLIYRLRVRADEHPFVLRWDVNLVPDHFTKLKLRAINQDQEIDMRSVKELEFSATKNEVYQFELVFSQRMVLELYPGWNMISLPGTPTADLTAKAMAMAMADKSETTMGSLFQWKSSGHSYQVVEELGLGAGYWFLTLNQNREEMELPLTPVDEYSIDLRAGWNMIGSVNHVCDFSNPQDMPDGLIVPSSLFEWNPKQ